MKSHLRNGLLAVAAVFSLSVAANAATIQVNSTAPTWTYTGGTSTNTTTSGSGNSAVTQIFWGTGTGSGQSGLGFNAAQPPTLNATPGVLFNLGTLTHYNNPITGNTPTSITLSLATNIQGVPTAQTFAFGFQVDETANAKPCTYPGTTVCPDKITFTNIDTTNAFTLSNQQYTMELIGFSTDGGKTTTSSFISEENCTNTADLYARFVAPHTNVPEPATLAIMGLGLIGLGAVRRRTNA